MEKNRKVKASTLEKKNTKRVRKQKSPKEEKSPKIKKDKNQDNTPKQKVPKEKSSSGQTKTTKKVSKSKKVKETTTLEPVLETETEPEVVVVEILDKKSLCVDLIFEQVSKLMTIIDIELLRMKGSPTKNTSAGKFLRQFKKQISTVRSNCGKLMKKKPKKTETKRTGGLAKPVEISKDLSTFAGWPGGELKSRVDVTRYICNYIKENQLQNPDNRRYIVPDNKLHSLLGANDSGEPLRYCDIQSRLKAMNHFIS